MCERPSTICGPIPPDPSLFPQYYRRPVSAQGRLEGNSDGEMAPLSGPIIHDSLRSNGCYTACTPPRPPRIGSNAIHIRERGQRGEVASLLQDSVCIGPSTPKQKQVTHDFGKENVRRMREIQRRCKEQEAERAHSRLVPVKALWTSTKYQSVTSKLSAQLKQDSSPSVKPQCKNFLRAHSGGLPRPESKTSPLPVQRRASCNSTKEPDLQLQIEGKSVNFICHNARAAGKTALRRSQSLTSLSPKPVPSAVKGQVPQYLSDRKEQLRKAEEERRKNAPDPGAPPGHTLMPEKKRQETLESLKETHCSLVNELLSFPIRSDILSTRMKRADLDRRLSEVEEGIKIFSRNKVYIKMDS